MKKVAIMMVILALILALCGCGSSSTPAQVEQAAAPAPEAAPAGAALSVAFPPVESADAHSIDDAGDMAAYYLYAWRDMFGFSRDTLIHFVEESGFPHDDAISGVDRIGVNWSRQASTAAMMLINDNPGYDAETYIANLEMLGFTREDAAAATDIFLNGVENSNSSALAQTSAAGLSFSVPEDWRAVPLGESGISYLANYDAAATVTISVSGGSPSASSSDSAYRIMKEAMVNATAQSSANYTAISTVDKIIAGYPAFTHRFAQSLDSSDNQCAVTYIFGADRTVVVMAIISADASPDDMDEFFRADAALTDSIEFFAD